MKTIAESGLKLLKKSESEIRKQLVLEGEGVRVYPDSVHKFGEALVMVARDSGSRFLLLLAPTRNRFPAGFEGEIVEYADGAAMKAPLSAANAAALRKAFPWCAPVSLRKCRSTVGCGDRLGLASRGHIRAARKFEVAPVLAQQSMRELSMTGRTFQNVVDDAVFMVFESDYRDGFGADGDHLKTIPDIDTAPAAAR